MNYHILTGCVFQLECVIQAYKWSEVQDSPLSSSRCFSKMEKRGTSGRQEGKLISPSDIGDTENKPRWLESQSSSLIWLHVQYECTTEAQTRELDEDYPHDCGNQMEWDARWPSVFAPDGAIAPQTPERDLTRLTNMEQHGTAEKQQGDTTNVRRRRANQANSCN